MEINKTFLTSALFVGSGAPLIAYGIHSYFSGPILPSESLSHLSDAVHANIIDLPSLFQIPATTSPVVGSTKSQVSVKQNLPELLNSSIRYQQKNKCRYWFSFGDKKLKSLNDSSLTQQEKLVAFRLFHQYSKKNSWKCGLNENIYFHKNESAKWSIASFQVL